MTSPTVRQNPVFGEPLPSDARPRRIEFPLANEVEKPSSPPEMNDDSVVRELPPAMRQNPFFGEWFSLESMAPEDAETSGFLSATDEEILLADAGDPTILGIRLRLLERRMSLGIFTWFRIVSCGHRLTIIAQSSLSRFFWVRIASNDSTFTAFRLVVALATARIVRILYRPILAQLLLAMLASLVAAVDRILPDPRPSPLVLAAGGQTTLHAPLN